MKKSKWIQQIVIRTLCIIAMLTITLLTACGVMLNLVFNGPSETVRNQAVLTLLADPKTAGIPGKFLEQAVIDEISKNHSSLFTTNDPDLISVKTGNTTLQSILIDGQTYTAQILLCQDLGEIWLADLQGSNYAGISSDGILRISTDENHLYSDHIFPCTQILMMDGIINSELYNSPSGYSARYAIGQCADGTMILVTIDGDTKDMLGATYQDLIDIFTEYDAVNACCLSCDPWEEVEKAQ